MTVINLAVQPKRRAAYLISDCAITHPDGHLMRVGGKIIAFERFPAAIGVSGTIDILSTGQAFFAADVRNLTGLVRALPAILRDAIKRTKVAYPLTPIVDGKLIVAAWSAKRGKPVGYFVSSWTGEAIGLSVDAFEVAELHSMHGSHIHVSELLDRRPCELEDADTFNPHEDAFRLVEAQRRAGSIDSAAGLAPGFCRIGGEVELTEVTRRGVKVWGCGTFPDKVGEPIVP